jgi:hypothetical protein
MHVSVKSNENESEARVVVMLKDHPPDCQPEPKRETPMNATRIQAIRATYNARNNQGLGYTPYPDEASDNTVEAAIEAAEADGWEVIYRAKSTSDITVLRTAGHALMAIGDSSGAWAVDVGE